MDNRVTNEKLCNLLQAALEDYETMHGRETSPLHWSSQARAELAAPSHEPQGAPCPVHGDEACVRWYLHGAKGHCSEHDLHQYMVEGKALKDPAGMPPPFIHSPPPPNDSEDGPVPRTEWQRLVDALSEIAGYQGLDHELDVNAANMRRCAIRTLEELGIRDALPLTKLEDDGYCRSCRDGLCTAGPECVTCSNPPRAGA